MQYPGIVVQLADFGLAMDTGGEGMEQQPMSLLLLSFVVKRSLHIMAVSFAGIKIMVVLVVLLLLLHHHFPPKLGHGGCQWMLQIEQDNLCATHKTNSRFWKIRREGRGSYRSSYTA
jgi:hypothetical protein